MLSDLWPAYALRITTPRLELRLPIESEIVALADVAAAGVHKPDERPFLTPWTEGSPRDRAQAVLRWHWEAMADWSVEDWSLGLGVFARDGRALGKVSLRAKDFPVVREVTRSSWLGLPHHGQGYGTEARLALLELAFEHLGAQFALTEVFQDNHASQAVSRRLGYQPGGVLRDARGDEVLVSDRLRLTRDRWAQLARPRILVEGVDACRQLFEPAPSENR
ncbi:MAG: GNAT family N-acetyltransferase [Motilibacteraceae bacterium]